VYTPVGWARTLLKVVVYKGPCKYPMKNLCAQSLTINALMAFAARRKGGGKYALAHNYDEGGAVLGIKLIVLASQLHKRPPPRT